MRTASLVAGALMAAGACARPESPASWPSRPVRVIVPYGPGASADLAARLLAPLLAARWHRPVVVDNRPGGDGIVGVQALVSVRDTHTLLFAPMGVITTHPFLHNPLPYDPARDLVPIAAVGRPGIGIAVTSAVGVESLQGLVAELRRRPDECLWSATPGLPELVFKAFLRLEGLRARHVAYGEVTAAVRDLAAGRLHVMVAALPTLHPAVDGGNARLMAVTASRRFPAVPDVPTAGEAGYPSLTVDGPFGYFGASNLPAELRDRIAGDIGHAAEDQAVVSRLTRVGFVVAAAGPGDFARSIEGQRRQVETIASILGLERPGAGGGR